MKIIIDTNIFISLQIFQDINHKKATTLFKEYQNLRAQFYTNTFVIDETLTRLVYDLSYIEANKFYKKIIEAHKSNEIYILETNKIDINNAWKRLAKLQDHKLSLTDGTIIEHLEQYNLDSIFTFDSHFQQVGCKTN